MRRLSPAIACLAYSVVLGAAGGIGPRASTVPPHAGVRAEPGVRLAEAKENERFDRSRGRERGTASERELRIRRAREEIRRNPQQKKFILFRFGLTEEDLR